jgi:GTPase SAR1 family protein
MHIRGLIIEGHSHSGKTSLINAIKKQVMNEKDSERNIIILGEHYSQILNLVNGKLESLDAEEHLKVLDKRVDMLRDLNSYAVDMGQAPRRSRGIFFILERFHLCHRANFHRSDDDYLNSIEAKLLKLNAKCVLLQINKDLEERVKSRSLEEWANKTDHDVKNYVTKMKDIQNKYVASSKISKIPTRIINTDEKKWDQYAKIILSDL